MISTLGWLEATSRRHFIESRESVIVAAVERDRFAHFAQFGQSDWQFTLSGTTSLVESATCGEHDAENCGVIPEAASHQVSGEITQQ